MVKRPLPRGDVGGDEEYGLAVLVLLVAAGGAGFGFGDAVGVEIIDEPVAAAVAGELVERGGVEDGGGLRAREKTS